MPDDCLNPMANDAGWPHIATDLRAENAKLCAEIERLRKIEAAARLLSDSLNGGFVVCRRCGDQEDTTNLDFASDLREALNAFQQYGSKE